MRDSIFSYSFILYIIDQNLLDKTSHVIAFYISKATFVFP